VSINPSNINVATGSTQDFTATVIGQHNPPQTVTWSISGNNSTNTIINSNGRLSVAGNESATSLIVTATSTYDNTKSGTATVTVSAPVVIFNVSNVAEWSQAVNYIRNGGNNRLYEINVSGEISLPVGTGSTFGHVIGLQVTIQGGGILSKSADGRLIGVGGNQTIIVRNIILDGQGNRRAIVDVEGGLFRMETGATLHNNGCTGVWVSGGRLIMHGGSISSNATISSSFGGGVTLVSSSSFTMHAGATISNNSSANTQAGWDENAGGVFIGSGSTLTMEGGIISSNTNYRRRGGGVLSIGSFIMNGGEISHNRSLENNTSGGGVFVVSGTAVLNGGVIQHNSATGSGGGVGIRATATFIMNGGSILNNNAGSSGGGVSSFGGEIGQGLVVSPGLFTMNGGIISNNHAVTSGGGVSAVPGTWAHHYGNFNKHGGTISNNIATGSGNSAFQAGNPNRWRNADAGPSVNTDDYGFWLND
jgi:hypothetical protein